MMGIAIIACSFIFLYVVVIWLVVRVLNLETENQLIRGKVIRIESDQRINNMRLIDTEILNRR